MPRAARAQRAASRPGAAECDRDRPTSSAALAQAVVVLLLVTLIVFVMLHALPGRGGAGDRSAQQATNPTTIAAVQPGERARQAAAGCSTWTWLNASCCTGNLGFSYKQNQSVAALLERPAAEDHAARRAVACCCSC